MNKTLMVRCVISKKCQLMCIGFSLFSMLFLTTGCMSQQAATKTTDNSKKQALFVDAPAGTAGYETPGILRASDILPPELLEGRHFDIHEDVVTFGFTNFFTITSPYGTFDAEGEDMLRTRVHELDAIAALRDIKKSNAFGNAAKKAASSSVKGAWSLISHPVSTVSGVHKGMGRLLSRVGEMVKGERGDSEDSVTQELIGFSVVKRKYADKFGVDVYSSNEVLQKELNSVAWAGFAGGVGVSLATMPLKKASRAAFYSVKGTKFIHGMNKIVLDYAPEDLRQINRDMLLQIGLEALVVEEFLRHPKFSPRHETIIVHALAELEGVKNRDQFIRQALHAETELDAFIFQRVAEMLYGYHINVVPLKEIIPLRRIAVGYTTDNVIVGTFPIDHLYWTERAALGLEAVGQLHTVERPVKQTELWITGRLSPRARSEFEAKGLVVKEQIGDMLMPPSL
ncbi:MAG: hypothetical protein H8D23_12600 [Candidatus Brocadiales bacterium]|nr:hypothetical protein [Candidatus Brocadiales bacterium]